MKSSANSAIRGTDLTLGQWFTELDQYRERIPLNVLTNGLKRLRVGPRDVRAFAQFSPERYRRNLMHGGPAYHALVLCWRDGQSSPIHDHRGSSCAVRVIQGEATETVFDITDEGRVFELRTRKLPKGFMCATQDLDIHRIANLQGDGADLITLHLYSPPLVVMGQYSLTDSVVMEFRDEVYDLGAGI